MSRHPYTYSCDFIRQYVGSNVSRANASSLRSAIADAICMDDMDLAIALAQAFVTQHGIVEHEDKHD
jgi:hypothetical protein